MRFNIDGKSRAVGGVAILIIAVFLYFTSIWLAALCAIAGVVLIIEGISGKKIIKSEQKTLKQELGINKRSTKKR